jgi:S-methyl-5-thioribose-1-phosphate isomerase
MKVKVDGEERDVLAVWREGGVVKMVDQRKLPHSFEIIDLNDHKETAWAIKVMVTRGAGSIGCAAGFGMAQAALEAADLPEEEFMAYLNEAADTLRDTRPTAANLFKAVDKCLKASEWGKVSVKVEGILREAEYILKDDIKATEAIAKAGAKLIKDGFKILTHCNAGALAYIGMGTALAPIRQAHRDGMDIFVWVNETRPRGQGARITAWELEQEGIPYALIADNAAGYYMQRGEVDMVIVGADRIAANGDTANKIGTYEKAVVAFENKIPFWVAAPGMTIDLQTKTGGDIEIEERDPREVTKMWGLNEEGEPTTISVAAEGTNARNPAFDVTPAKFINGFITEHGLVERPFIEAFYWLFGQPGLPPGFKYAGT